MCCLKESYIIGRLMEFCSDALTKEESKVLMGEIHEGVCGSHQSVYKMKWVIRRNGYFWPTMLEDSSFIIKVVKGVRNLEMCREHRHRL